MSGSTLSHWNLRRAGLRVEVPKTTEPTKQPPKRRGVALIACGNSGEEIALRVRAHAWRDGYDVLTLFLNNDRRAPNPIPLRAPNGETLWLRADERLVIGTEGNARDLIKEFPLLVARYEDRGLLRGISVHETFQRTGSGGRSLPVLSAMDLDLQFEMVYGFLRKGLGVLRDGGQRAETSARSDLERMIMERTRRQQADAQSWIVAVLGGASGSKGNASHQLLPHVVREILSELGIRQYELWGLLFGPKAFTGLTRETLRNFYALLTSLHHMSQYGLQREYINGLRINSATPPYDRIFLLDDPLLPREKNQVTEAEQLAFFDRAATSIHLLLDSDVWSLVDGHMANAAHELTAAFDNRLRVFHTINGVMAGVDREGLGELAALNKQAQLLDALVTQLAA